MSMIVIFSHSSLFFLFFFLSLFFCFGREELLSEHAIHWNRRKIEGLPYSPAKRSTKL